MSALIGAGLAGGCAAAGVWMLARSRRELLTPASAESEHASAGGAVEQAGRSFVPLLRRTGLPTASIRADLVLCDTSEGQYLAEKAGGTIAASALVLLLLGAHAAGVSLLPPLALLVLAAACVGACWKAPDLAVHAQARKRREELRSASSMLADLAVIALAGGAGVSGALAQAARHGTGWAPEKIRAALHTAAVKAEPGWQGLGELGDRAGVVELSELAASLELAGTDGARVRASLASKAASLRTAELAAAEARAAADTERMTLPVTVLVLGFMGLVGYPALVHVITGF
uniref:hypothetical protein n=1 Tax=Nocardiopsis chromatogenes TaxID=280239 RepID=UPI000377A6AF|nr:hypothetical protein [Nocardiopsis chromatogenes]